MSFHPRANCHPADPNGPTPDPAAASAAANLPGSHLLAARVWPAPRLPRSHILMSPGLRENAGQPPPGTVVLLYRPTATIGPPPSSDDAATPGPPSGVACKGAFIDVMVPVSSAAAVGTVGAVAATVSGVTSGGTVVVLQLCGEVLLQPRVSSFNAATTSPANGGGVPPPSPLRTPSGKGAKATATAATPTYRTASVDAGTSAASGALQQWPLDTLLKAAEARDEATRLALAAIGRRHLAGRLLVEGSPLLLPVLGSSVMFRVAATLAAAGRGAVPLRRALVVEMGRDTQLQVLYPGEPLPAVFRGGEDAGGGGGGGAEVVSGPGASIARQRAVAREAAMAVVPESAAEAAADAAERALLAGEVGVL